MNNGNVSSIKTIEIDSDSDDLNNSCQILNDHQENIGIEVKKFF